MLTHIRVRNIALIDETDIDLDEGLNVLTGETGAGKSILLGAVSLALGAKASRDIVRDPSRKAEVVLLFSEDRPSVLEKLSSLGISAENGEILISRRFTGLGRSVLLINDSMVTQEKAREVSSVLIDIHGQHDHESLLNQSRHIDLLDRFIPQMPALLEQCSQEWSQTKALEQELSRYQENGRDRARLISLMQYELQEIDEAGWKEGEEEELQSERRKLLYSGRLAEACQKAYSLLEEDSAEGASVLTSAGEALSCLKQVSEYDKDFFDPFVEQLQNTCSVLEDTASSLRSYAEKLEADPERQNQIEERLDVLDHLKSKYGSTRSQVLSYARKTKTELDRLENLEQTLSDLNDQLSRSRQKLQQTADRMTAERRQAAKRLETQITDVLKTLEFQDPSFRIQIEPRPVGPKGQDKVTFQIRTNVGEEVRPLSQIASGGELSRIMLAVKTVLARQDEIGTLIFDEIDTGISGRTAQSVAEKMSLIAQYRQVIAVTHLPQIAAMADVHLRIEKLTDHGHARTVVTRLTGDGITRELSRMLGGAEITQAVRENAAEMKTLAEEWKKTRQDEAVS